MLDTSLHGARCVHIGELYAVKHVQNKITYLVFAANVANFVLFARALCERCRICIIRCAFLEFTRLTPSLLVMVWI